MASFFGENIRFSVFGESHGAGVGVVVDAPDAGLPVDLEALSAFVARRAPGRDDVSTPRKEADVPEVLSGVLNGMTTGAPMTLFIRNTNTRSGDYKGFDDLPRPSHADFTALQKFGKFNDFRGGGHFSGRLTGALCMAGGLCKQWLEDRGIFIGAHLYAVDGIHDTPFDPVRLDRETLLSAGKKLFPVLDDKAAEEMREHIFAARQEGDSVGGVIEVAALGLPAGIGNPMFEGLEGMIAKAVFGVPGVRGLEFGAGFAAAAMRGSAHNDAFTVENGAVRTATNNAGGVLGGISTGMPLLFRVAMKPTPSIARLQTSVRITTLQEEEIRITGRHDPCIAPRAVPVMEAMLAMVLTDILK